MTIVSFFHRFHLDSVPVHCTAVFPPQVQARRMSSFNRDKGDAEADSAILIP